MIYKTSLVLISALVLAACSSSNKSSNTSARVFNSQPGTISSNNTNNTSSNTNNNNTNPPKTGVFGGKGGNTNTNNQTNVPSNNTNTNPTVSAKPSISVAGRQAVFQPNQAGNSFALTVGSTTYKDGEVDLKSLGDGFKEVDLKQELTRNSDNRLLTSVTGKARIYQQPHSVVVGVLNTGMGGSMISGDFYASRNHFDNVMLKGTPSATLPTAGSYTYTGEAFNHDKKGQLSYTVDFQNKTGSGKITNIDSQDILLNQGTITDISHTNRFDNTVVKGKGISSTTSRDTDKGYTLGFFGDNAAEVAGVIQSKENKNRENIGFGGKR